jgi:hypothetical protein
MSIAATAAEGMMAKAPKAPIDPLKAPPDRSWIAVSPLASRGNIEQGSNDEMLVFLKESGADGVLLLGSTGEGNLFQSASAIASLKLPRATSMSMISSWARADPTSPQIPRVEINGKKLGICTLEFLL